MSDEEKLKEQGYNAILFAFQLSTLGTSNGQSDTLQHAHACVLCMMGVLAVFGQHTLTLVFACHFIGKLLTFIVLKGRRCYTTPLLSASCCNYLVASFPVICAGYDPGVVQGGAFGLLSQANHHQPLGLRTGAAGLS